MSKTIKEQLSKTNFHRKIASFNPDEGSFRTEIDGKDHVNISITGDTELGRMLSPEWVSKFVHPVLGPFDHMTGFWTYSKSKSHADYYRSAKPSNCLNFAKEHDDNVTNVANFKAVILSGIYNKIMQNEKLKNLVKGNDLKFEIYFTKIHEEDNEGSKISYIIKIPSPYSKWMIGIYEEARKAVQEDREPDYSKFRDKKTTPLYINFAEIVEIKGEVACSAEPTDSSPIEQPADVSVTESPV